MIRSEEVHLLVETIKQHNGIEVPTESALAALYALEQYRYGALQSNVQQQRKSRPADTQHTPKRNDAALCQRCHRPMRIVQITPIGTSEFRTFECLNCKSQQASVAKRA
jgi:hypothetical protein